MITVLSGGIGGSRFLQGLVRAVEPREITVGVNTGDDADFHGLRVCPDLDIITYALAGLVDEEKGWGLHGDTFQFLEAMSRLGHETWFSIGDRDLATHVHRTLLLGQGLTLSQVTAAIARSFGVEVRLLPMSDDPVPTQVATDAGVLGFQEYLVKRGARDRVRSVGYTGADTATPTPGVIEAIDDARAVIVAPSNPIGSIGPILALPGVREALGRTTAPVAAVSPVVDGRAFQPPTAEMMEGLGLEVSAHGVARLYRDFIDVMVIDHADAGLVDRITDLGVRVVVTGAVMRGPEERLALARETLEAALC
jgi:LPPG:FO 2-phospho-L-lactate transferase